LCVCRVRVDRQNHARNCNHRKRCQNCSPNRHFILLSKGLVDHASTGNGHRHPRLDTKSQKISKFLRMAPRPQNAGIRGDAQRTTGRDVHSAGRAQPARRLSTRRRGARTGRALSQAVRNELAEYLCTNDSD
jgi:hypothetical protein